MDIFRITDSNVTRFSKWLEEREEKRDLAHIPHTLLDTYIGSYMMTATKLDGDEYEPDSLTGMHRAIARRVKDLGGPDIIKNDAF